MQTEYQIVTTMRRLFHPSAALVAALAASVSGCTDRAAGEQDAAAGKPQDSYEKSTLLAIDRVSALSLGVLQDAAPSASPCSLDSVGGTDVTSTVSVDGKVRQQLRGWLANETAPGGSAAFRIVLKGENQAYAISVPARVARPDVASYFHNKKLEQSGFNVNAPLDRVAPGDYEVGFLFANGGKDFYCNSNKRMALRG